MTVAQRYRAVVDRVARAAERAGREPSSVTVLAAAKSFSGEVVAEALHAGCTDVGENYVQEARTKREALERVSLRPRWHFIGRLQRNKARAAVRIFDVIESLDSMTLALALDRAATVPVDCLVEVRLVPERTKGGIAAEELGDFLAGLAELPLLRVRGLMAIPPATDDPMEARGFFRRLRELRDRYADLPLPNVQLKELSMGMSADFEVAVAEGATIVRVGQAIFGPRD